MGCQSRWPAERSQTYVPRDLSRLTSASARRADFQFPRQIFQLAMRVPETLVEEDIPRLTREFIALYAETYGPGTAWEETAPIMINYTEDVQAR